MREEEFIEARKLSDLPLCFSLDRWGSIEIDDDAIISIEDVYGKHYRFRARRLKEVTIMRPDYESYILSDDWAKRRDLYFQSHPRSCYFCGSGERIQLHHLTYDRLGWEQDNDLEPLCDKCHQKLHQFAEVIRHQPTTDKHDRVAE